MSYSLIWLPSVLQNAGLKVALADGWESRGRGDMGEIKGIICHHTAGSAKGNMPTLNLLIKGRPDLAGPLAQLGLGRDGTFYVLAAGRCNHAGKGNWRGLVNGNTNFIGIEAENTGLPSDPWPDIQMNAYKHGVAAILKHLGLDANACCGHKEYALPQGRKNDPNFSMSEFRSGVADILAGNAAPIKLIPRAEASGQGRKTIRRGDKGEQVMALQKGLGLEADGIFGAMTEAAVREFQRSKKLVPDGIVGPKTWGLIVH